MTGLLYKIPQKELERHHKQAHVFLREALFQGDEELHETAQVLEERCRHERVRRALSRAPHGPRA